MDVLRAHIHTHTQTHTHTLVLASSLIVRNEENLLKAERTSQVSENTYREHACVKVDDRLLRWP